MSDCVFVFICGPRAEISLAGEARCVRRTRTGPEEQRSGLSRGFKEPFDVRPTAAAAAQVSHQTQALQNG